jgi:hypothetical protein
MTSVHQDPGVLMPLGSIVAIGTSQQGAAVLSILGVAPRGDLATTLPETIDLLAGSPEGDELAACLRLVSASATRADRWLHITSDTGSVPPSVVLSGPGSTLVCCLHGDLVEWVAGDDDLLPGVVQRAVEATGGRAVTVSLFDRDVCLGSVRFAAGAMDAAARSEEDLVRLTRARDVAEAVHALRSVSDARGGTP